MRIVEEESVKQLIAGGVVVITVGGGGIPVVSDDEGNLLGTATVIDKDFASSLLASNIGADLVIISTAVEKVALNFGKPDEKWLDTMTLAEAKQHRPRPGRRNWHTSYGRLIFCTLDCISHVS